MKTPPSVAWTPRSEPFPPIGELVDVCWEVKPGVYEYGELRLKRHFLQGEHKMSEWINKDNLPMIFNPDFWARKPVKISALTLDLTPYEAYLGAHLVDSTLHHLIMVAADDSLRLQSYQKEWAKSLNARLPTLAESHLLIPTLRKFRITVWLNETSGFVCAAGNGTAAREDVFRAIAVRSVS